MLQKPSLQPAHAHCDVSVGGEPTWMEPPGTCLGRDPGTKPQLVGDCQLGLPRPGSR